MKDLAASLEASRRQHAEGCVKTWEDLARYQIALERADPKVVVELGTFSGKSAVWLAEQARCPVVTVDVNPQVDVATLAEGRDRGVVWLRGGSTDPEIVSYVTGFAHGCGAPGGQARAFVVLDSDHSGPHVRRELDAYWRLVPPGGYMVVEDGLLRWMDPAERAHYDGDPLDALEAWLPEHPDFEPDRELEDLYPTTQFPSGWLRRLG